MKPRYLYNRKILACMFASMLLCMHVFAQAPPSNDDCSGAILVSTYPYSDLGGTYTSVNTTFATRSTPNPTCVTSSDNNDDVWYKFVAVTQVELLRINSAVAGSSYVTFGYALYDGCGGTQIACDNEMGTFTGKALLGGLVPGNTYYLRLWLQYNFTSFTCSFCIQDIIPSVASNESGTATPLNINSPGQRCIAPQFYTTAGATRSAPNPGCTSDNDDDIWFQFTCPPNAVMIITEQGVENNTGAFGALGMEIRDATAGYATSCTSYYPSGSTTSMSGIAGHLYLLRIWGYGNGTSPVTFSMCMQQGYDIYPANDSCEHATELAVSSGSCSNPITGNLANAKITVGMTGNPSCASPMAALTNDVWYKLTVPSTGNVTIQTSATHTAVNDLVMQAYTGTCGNFTQIACDEDGNPDPFPSANHSKISLTGRTAGEVIYLRVVPRNINNMGGFQICAYDTTTVTVPSISMVNAYTTEGNLGTKQLLLNVNLSKASTQQVQVTYNTKNYTAVTPADYTKTSGVLTFAPGDTTETISVTINGDTSVEADEAFKIKLSNPVNATIAKTTGYGAIVDDDGPTPPAFTSADIADLTKENTGIGNKLKMYPNPANEQLTVELKATSKQGQLQIFDMAGHLLKQMNLSVNQQKIIINVSALKSGAYVMKVTDQSGSCHATFIKQ